MQTRNITLRTLPVKRSQGQSAVAGAAYRAGEKLVDNRLGKSADYTGRKPDVWQSEILAPTGAPDWALNREQLWNTAEEAERRKDGRPARDVTLGLPWSMSREEHEEAARSFVQSEFVDKGHIVDLCFHKYGKRVSDFSEDGRATIRRWAEREVPFLDAEFCEGYHDPHVKIERDGHGNVLGYKIFQPHAHAYVTPRALDGDSFAAKRNREFDRPEQTMNWRYEWPRHLNERLSNGGYEFQVSATAIEEDSELPLKRENIPLSSYHIEQQGEQSHVSEQRDHNKVHNEAVRNAAATMQAEDRGQIERPAERFSRVRGWFQSMRQSFSEWRNTIEEHARSWFQREAGPDEPEPPPPQWSEATPSIGPDEQAQIPNEQQEQRYDRDGPDHTLDP